MKRIILICPEQRPGLDDLAGGVPLALAIYLGKPLIDHALDGFAQRGVSEVLLLASDRPHELRDYVGDGSAWGVKVTISAEATELTTNAAAERHAAFQADAIHTLDQLPQAPDQPILNGAASWHQSRAHLLPLLAANQIGAREISPGVWCGMKTRIHDSAILQAPCWIGHHTQINAHASVGPHGYVENDSVAEAHATVENSTVGARTYLGGMTHLKDSIAAGPVLVNWQNGSQTRLTDAFLLSHLDPPRQALSSLPGRALALLLIILTLPLLILALFGRPWKVRRVAVLPGVSGEPQRSCVYHELPALPGKLRRWPYLWRVVTGDFAWIGNPPLNPEEAARLEHEFERLWLQAGPGIFTAPEAEGCTPPWDDAAHAHAALFACQATAAWKWKILVNGLKRILN